jgi:hypothetical protein
VLTLFVFCVFSPRSHHAGAELFVQVLKRLPRLSDDLPLPHVAALAGIRKSIAHLVLSLTACGPSMYACFVGLQLLSRFFVRARVASTFSALL